MEAILRLKMAEDGCRWSKISPKYGSLVKREGFWGFRRALQVPGGVRRAQDGPSGGFLGPLEGLLEAILRLKLAHDRSSWPKIAPKHESFVKYEGFWGFRRALQAPRRRPEGPRQALWGPPGAS